MAGQKFLMYISEASGRQTELVGEGGDALYSENELTKWSPCGYQGRPSTRNSKNYHGSRILLLSAPEHSAMHRFLP